MEVWVWCHLAVAEMMAVLIHFTMVFMATVNISVVKSTLLSDRCFLSLPDSSPTLFCFNLRSGYSFRVFLLVSDFVEEALGMLLPTATSSLALALSLSLSSVA
jgi:hypothetical protein